MIITYLGVNISINEIVIKIIQFPKEINIKNSTMAKIIHLLPEQFLDQQIYLASLFAQSFR